MAKFKTRGETPSKAVLRETCKQMYMIDGISIKDISETMDIPTRTLYRWRKLDEWEYVSKTGSIELSLNLEQELVKEINKAIENGTLGNPQVADAIAKIQKVAASLRPQRQVLGNLLVFAEELVNYASGANDPAFLNSIQKHLPEFVSKIKAKYNQ